MNAIILAAGKGTRMQTELPKCAYPFLGKPMVCHIVEACQSANIDNIYVVVGYKKEDIIECLNGYENITYCEQVKQEGTGSAVKVCKEALKDNNELTIILAGDMPLVDKELIDGLVHTHNENKNTLTVVSTIMEDPKRYGRIYREDGYVKKIVEAKDASEEVLKIKEINSGLYCVNNQVLFEALDLVTNNNKANEYYLTDIVEIIGSKEKVDTFVVEESYKLEGFNDVPSLEQAELNYKKLKNR